MRMAGESGEGGKHLAGRYPRDLLRQFSGGVVFPEGTSAGNEEDSDEIELSLGLSLGGCFGVDPARKRGLQRSSSIAAIPFLKHEGEEEEDDVAVSPMLLKRTASLPAEAEEEQRKRKDLQCLRRMEAKRKRSERESCPGKWGRDPASPPGEEGDGRWGWPGRPAAGHLGGWWTPNRVAAAAAASRGGGMAAADGTMAAAPQGSVGSQWSSSSAISDFGSRPPKHEELVSNGTGHWRRTQPLPDHTERNNGPTTAGKPAKKGSAGAGGDGEVEAPRKEQQPKAAMEEMPCVSTRGGGPNGRLVEGFLYKYGKGEEVRIVCVCHGRFLSPAEFVRHAGGEDVAHPLRHIMVNPSPSSFL